MRFTPSFKAGLGLGLMAASVSSHELHLATKGLLQIPPSFSGDGITLYPGHHPEHDPHDLGHLIPQLSNQLHYSQEGHRPALHGAKHGSMKATFGRPTVVLDHSSHLQSIQCSNEHIKVCFKSPEAFQTVVKSWHFSGDGFNLVTFHLGCGDQTTGKRSFFHASHPTFDTYSSCVKVATAPIQEHEALESGELSWGTYQDPVHRERVPTKGHIRVDKPDDPPLIGHGNLTRGPIIDLTQNATALKDFFEDPDLDTSHIHDQVNGTLEFISTNGSVVEHVSKRQIASYIINNLAQGERSGALIFFKTISDYFVSAVKIVVIVAKLVIKVAIVAAKLIAVPFGVPFNHSYHDDFKFNTYLKSQATNRPPAILGHTEGFNLASSGKVYSIQCVKCGIRGDFSIDGELAFSIQNGITKGKVSLVNREAFVLDAQFGITVELQKQKEIEKFKKQVAAAPLSPFAIPGIITLGPQASIAVELDLTLNGKAELVLGGSLSIKPGTAVLSLVDKKQNGIKGLDVKFTPVVQAKGAITVTADLGLPIALEVGLDLLNGKFKKTVGFINKPSVYAQAIYSKGEGHKCDGGVEIRIGAKHRMYISAIDLWDYDIKTFQIYDRGLSCLTIDGFNNSKVEPDSGIFAAVSKDLGGDFGNTSVPTVTDVAKDLKSPHTKGGFRVIMDQDKTSILVAGKDGYIYLTQTAEKYDLSSPWGSVDANSTGVNFDVFGRIMSSITLPSAAEVRVYSPNKVPAKERAAALSTLKDKSKDYYVYGVVLTVDQKKFKQNLLLWYPTFCKTKNGLRLVPTKFPFDQDGKIHAENSKGTTNIGDIVSQVNSIKALGVDPKNCHTVWLTSKIDGV